MYKHTHRQVQIYLAYKCYLNARYWGLDTKSLRVTELKVDHSHILDRFESSGYKGTVLKQFANLSG